MSNKYLKLEDFNQPGNKELHKSYENDLNKAGEGSRGGKVIGHTSSGKPIYADHFPEHYSNFSKKDHLDAAEVHGETYDGNRKEHHNQVADAHERWANDMYENKKEKSKDNNIEKAGGEGSRGGKVIGHTKSGKAIYDSPGKEQQNLNKIYTKQDHLDAHEHHSKKSKEHNDRSIYEKFSGVGGSNDEKNEAKERSKNNSDLAIHHKNQAEYHKNKASDTKDDKTEHNYSTNKEAFSEQVKRAREKHDHSDTSEEEKKKAKSWLDGAKEHNKKHFEKSDSMSDIEKAFQTLGVGSVNNDFEKGTPHKNHKYLRIENGKYIYDEKQMTAKDHANAHKFHFEKQYEHHNEGNNKPDVNPSGEQYSDFDEKAQKAHYEYHNSLANHHAKLKKEKFEKEYRGESERSKSKKISKDEFYSKFNSQGTYIVKTKKSLDKESENELDKRIKQPFKLFSSNISKSAAKRLAETWGIRSAGWGFLGVSSKIVKNKDGAGYDLYLGPVNKDHVNLLKQGYRNMHAEEAYRAYKNNEIELEDIKNLHELVKPDINKDSDSIKKAFEALGIK